MPAMSALDASSPPGGHQANQPNRNQNSARSPTRIDDTSYDCQLSGGSSSSNNRSSSIRLMEYQVADLRPRLHAAVKHYVGRQSGSPPGPQQQLLLSPADRGWLNETPPPMTSSSSRRFEPSPTKTDGNSSSTTLFTPPTPSNRSHSSSSSSGLSPVASSLFAANRQLYAAFHRMSPSRSDAVSAVDARRRCERPPREETGTGIQPRDRSPADDDRRRAAANAYAFDEHLHSFIANRGLGGGGSVPFLNQFFDRSRAFPFLHASPVLAASMTMTPPSCTTPNNGMPKSATSSGDQQYRSGGEERHRRSQYDAISGLPTDSSSALLKPEMDLSAVASAATAAVFFQQMSGLDWPTNAASVEGDPLSAMLRRYGPTGELLSLASAATRLASSSGLSSTTPRRRRAQPSEPLQQQHQKQNQPHMLPSFPSHLSPPQEQLQQPGPMMTRPGAGCSSPDGEDQRPAVAWQMLDQMTATRQQHRLQTITEAAGDDSRSVQSRHSGGTTGGDDEPVAPADSIVGDVGSQAGSSSMDHHPSQQQQQQQSRGDDRSDDVIAGASGVTAGIFPCHVCGFVCMSQADNQQHARTHLRHNCDLCGYLSGTPGRLKRHKLECHRTGVPADSTTSPPAAAAAASDGKRMKKCRKCSFKTIHLHEFYAHTRAHIRPDRIIQCPMCPFATQYGHHLELHLRNHVGSRPFHCTICSYRCPVKSMLTSHMKSHSPVNPYRCSKCLFSTKFSNALKRHLLNKGHELGYIYNKDGSVPEGGPRPFHPDGVSSRRNRPAARCASARKPKGRRRSGSSPSPDVDRATMMATDDATMPFSETAGSSPSAVDLVGAVTRLTTEDISGGSGSSGIVTTSPEMIRQSVIVKMEIEQQQQQHQQRDAVEEDSEATTLPSIRYFGNTSSSTGLHHHQHHQQQHPSPPTYGGYKPDSPQRRRQLDSTAGGFSMLSAPVDGISGRWCCTICGFPARDVDELRFHLLSSHALSHTSVAALLADYARTPKKKRRGQVDQGEAGGGRWNDFLPQPIPPHHSYRRDATGPYAAAGDRVPFGHEETGSTLDQIHNHRQHRNRETTTSESPAMHERYRQQSTPRSAPFDQYAVGSSTETRRFVPPPPPSYDLVDNHVVREYQQQQQIHHQQQSARRYTTGYENSDDSRSGYYGGDDHMMAARSSSHRSTVGGDFSAENGRRNDDYLLPSAGAYGAPFAGPPPPKTITSSPFENIPKIASRSRVDTTAAAEPNNEEDEESAAIDVAASFVPLPLDLSAKPRRRSRRKGPAYRLDPTRVLNESTEESPLSETTDADCSWPAAAADRDDDADESLVVRLMAESQSRRAECSAGCSAPLAASTATTRGSPIGGHHHGVVDVEMKADQPPASAAASGTTTTSRDGGSQPRAMNPPKKNPALRPVCSPPPTALPPAACVVIRALQSTSISERPTVAASTDLSAEGRRRASTPLSPEATTTGSRSDVSPTTETELASSPPSLTGADQLWECRHCGMGFIDRILYDMHMEFHNPTPGAYPFSCNLCGHWSKDQLDFFMHIAKDPHTTTGMREVGSAISSRLVPAVS